MRLTNKIEVIFIEEFFQSERMVPFHASMLQSETGLEILAEGEL